MTWRANGDYYSFREEMIRFHTPPASGVYGLYNFRHQILIGNSANIQNALLRHLRETKYRFRRFVPTGFVFELCAPEARESRAQELIREYDPILQSSRPLAALWHSWMTPKAMPFFPRASAVKPAASNRAKKDATDVKKKRLKEFRFGREQFALIASGFGATLLVMGVIMLPTHLKDEPGAPWQPASVERNLTHHPAAETQVALLTTPQAPSFLDQSSEEAGVFELKNKPAIPPQAALAIEQPRGKDLVASEQPADNRAVNRESETAWPKAGSKLPEPQIAKNEDRKGGWAVQVMATTDPRIARDELERLKARGYDAFLTKAEIKGQTWYRLRAGNFGARQEAEALRKTLQSKEGFRDAFVAPSAKSQTFIALNPR